MSEAAAVTTVPRVDLARYMGDWFEICRLPMRFEDETAFDITATYCMEGDAVRVDNRCIDEDGKPSQAIGEARPQDDSNAKLTVSFLPEFLRWVPFTKGDYWVLKLDEAYSVALVGTPDRKFMWLLARTHMIADDVREDYLAEARRQGFDLSRLITPRQSGRKVEDASFE
ncbi:MAG: lipocalin family protein [Mesorhizobium sp.]